MAGDDDVDDDLPPLDVVPVSFSATKKRRDPVPEERFVDRLRAMKGAEVEVVSGGVRYRGLLIGADEQDLYLRAVLRWLVLPLDRVTSVHQVDEAIRPMGGPRPEDTGEDR